jgi:L-threonylcarbamoyladenylate synthase
MIIISQTDHGVAERAVAVLHAGGILIAPTDTVYGIGCGYDHSDTLKKIVQLKGRDEQKPMALLASSIGMVSEYVVVTPKMRAGLSEVWPGPFTAVLPRVDGSGNEGMRIPNHAFIRAVIDTYGKPLSMTSANRAGEPALTHSAAVIRDFEGIADDSVLMVDGGDLPDSMASTVVDLTATPPKILRAGPISRERLMEIFKTTFQ